MRHLSRENEGSEAMQTEGGEEEAEEKQLQRTRVLDLEMRYKELQQR